MSSSLSLEFIYNLYICIISKVSVSRYIDIRLFFNLLLKTLGSKTFLSFPHVWFDFANNFTKDDTRHEEVYTYWNKSL